jgi:hypothetical protein
MTAGENFKVLVVEDNPSDRLLYRMALKPDRKSVFERRPEKAESKRIAATGRTASSWISICLTWTDWSLYLP